MVNSIWHANSDLMQPFEIASDFFVIAGWRSFCVVLWSGTTLRDLKIADAMMKTGFLQLKCVIFSLIIMSGTAGAVPLSYDEASDGDIISSSTTFALDFGANTVAGTVSCGVAAGTCDFDNFSVTLPSSANLASVDLSLLLALDGNGLFANQFKVNVPPFFFISTIAGGAFTIPIGLSASTVDLIGLGLFPAGFANDYTISINVVNAIPEPATLALFAFGLAVLGFMTRRRRRGAVAA